MSENSFVSPVCYDLRRFVPKEDGAASYMDGILCKALINLLFARALKTNFFSAPVCIKGCIYSRSSDCRLLFRACVHKSSGSSTLPALTCFFFAPMHIKKQDCCPTDNNPVFYHNNLLQLCSAFSAKQSVHRQFGAAFRA